METRWLVCGSTPPACGLTDGWLLKRHAQTLPDVGHFGIHEESRICARERGTYPHTRDLEEAGDAL